MSPFQCADNGFYGLEGLVTISGTGAVGDPVVFVDYDLLLTTPRGNLQLTDENSTVSGGTNTTLIATPTVLEFTQVTSFQITLDGGLVTDGRYRIQNNGSNVLSEFFEINVGGSTPYNNPFARIAASETVVPLPPTFLSLLGGLAFLFMSRRSS